MAATCSDEGLSVMMEDDTWGKKALELLRSLWISGQRCDTTLVTDDNHTFTAHSTFLAACSPVLRSSFPQTTTGEFLVPLNSVSSSAVNVLLNFLYTGQVSCDSHHLVDLLMAAEQLGIQHIQDFLAHPAKFSGKPDTCNAATDIEEKIFQLIGEPEIGSDDAVGHQRSNCKTPKFTDAATNTDTEQNDGMETEPGEEKKLFLNSVILKKAVEVDGDDDNTDADMGSLQICDEQTTTKKSMHNANDDQLAVLSPMGSRKRIKTSAMIAYEEQRKKTHRKQFIEKREINMTKSEKDEDVPVVKIIDVKEEKEIASPLPKAKGKKRGRPPKEEKGKECMAASSPKHVESLQDQKPPNTPKRKYRGAARSTVPPEIDKEGSPVKGKIKKRGRSSTETKDAECVGSISSKHVESAHAKVAPNSARKSADGADKKIKLEDDAEWTPISEKEDVKNVKKESKKDQARIWGDHNELSDDSKVVVKIEKEATGPQEEDACILHTEVGNDVDELAPMEKSLPSDNKLLEAVLDPLILTSSSEVDCDKKKNFSDSGHKNKVPEKVKIKAEESHPPKEKRQRRKKGSEPVDHICKHCGFKFKFRSALKIHELRHEKVKPFKCDECDKAYYIHSELVTHKRLHTGERPFQCQYCGREFYDTAVCRQHERRHRDREEDAGTFPCQVTGCNIEFARESERLVHEVTAHGVQHQSFPCLICNKVFYRKIDFKRHALIHEKGLSCSTCKKAFSRKAALIMHERTHTGERPFRCNHCDRSYVSAIALKSHEMKHISEKQFKCDYCTKRFWRKFEKDLHERTHTNIKPYLCNTCGKAYKSISHLRVHERVHTGARPYKCEICNARFSARNTLVRHMAIHSSDRPFVCECGKTFRRKGHLVVHQRTHVASRFQLSTDASQADGNIIQVVQYEEATKKMEGTGELQVAIEGETVNLGSLSELQEIAGSEIKLEGITAEELEQAPIYIQIVTEPQDQQQ